MAAVVLLREDDDDDDDDDDDVLDKKLLACAHLQGLGLGQKVSLSVSVPTWV